MKINWKFNAIYYLSFCIGIVLCFPTLLFSQTFGEPELNEVAKGEVALGDELTPDVYVIQDGDTLWDISDKFLTSPWQWPKLWSYNPQITNPHWIYPGNKIRFVKGEGELLPEEGGVTNVVLGPEDEVVDEYVESIDDENLENMVAVVGGMKIGYRPKNVKTMTVRNDVYLSSKMPEHTASVWQSADNKRYYSPNDKIYIKVENGKTVQEGDEYTVFRKIKDVVYGEEEKHYGFLIQVVGSVKVLENKSDKAIAQVFKANSDIHKGDYIGSIIRDLTKNIKAVENTSKVVGKIIDALSDRKYISEFEYIIIDKGSKHGVVQGNSFIVTKQDQSLASKTEVMDFPEDVFASLVVTSTSEIASIALVTRSLKEVYRGDKIVMRLKK